MSANGKPVTRDELMVALKALGDHSAEREAKVMAQVEAKTRYRPQKAELAIVQPPIENVTVDTAALAAAFQQFFAKYTDQAASIVSALEKLELVATVQPTVTTPNVELRCDVSPTPVEVHNEVKGAEVYLDLAELSGLVKQQTAALERNGKALTAVVASLRQLAERKVKRVVHRDSAGDIESVTEEVA